MSGAATPTAVEAPPLDDRDVEPRTPMKRLGSTRKLAAFNNIRMQLSEQTRVLEARAEATAGVAGELHDYCRRRADLEHEYARALDKLARAATQRHKDQKHKREQWALTGAYACWQAALESTRALSRDHAALGELYGGPLAARLQRAADDALRLHRKCRDVVGERHEEVGAALAEAAAAGKAHAGAAADWRAAALKLRHAYDQRQRLAAADPPRHKKIKALDKELEKRRTRHSEARVRALRARADYVLSLEAANATLQRYYLDDIADIILMLAKEHRFLPRMLREAIEIKKHPNFNREDGWNVPPAWNPVIQIVKPKKKQTNDTLSSFCCMEVGFEAVVGRAVRTAAAGECARAGAAGAAGDALRAAADALDALADRQRLLDAHAQAFALPRPLPYQGTAPDVQDAEARDLLGAAHDDDAPARRVAAELGARLTQLDAGARALRAECRENAKTLDAAEAELVKQMEGADAHWDVSGLFGAAGGGAAAVPTGPPPAPEDQEDYYLAKFRSYVSCAGRLARLESKAAGVRARLLGPTGGAPPARAASPPTPPRRAAARLRRGQFAAPLDHRLPVVLTSCVRVIATYGLRHQGIFRVSGSQVEMQALRAAFERGEDPLAGVRDASDMNSVCGLLKLYLREVRPPLLPPQLQERLLRVAALPDDEQFVLRMRSTLAALPQPAVIVLRYLFAFLAHLTEYSEHNMMDAWNLAICLGPTLLAAWGEGGAQVTAQNLVNELVKRIILHHEDIFPQDIAPYALYTRFSEAEGEGEGEAGAAGGDDTDAGAHAHGADAHAHAHDGAPDENGHDSAPGLDAQDEHDVADDLSLYDDDDDEDDTTDEEGGSGDWGERDSGEYRRPGSAERRASAQAEASPADGAAAAACTSAPQCRRLAESTPDLVLDLPARAPAPAPADSADSADTFAHNRDTLKKRPARRASRSEGQDARPDEPPPAPEPAPAPAPPPRALGSPVPARNTARVAAKFAELTLTGGSLKPALAAKPALLRRPTPHPHAPRAPPRDSEPAC